MPKNASPKLTTGLKGSAEITVGPQHTAPHIGSGYVKVLATPVMVTLMEAAALQALDGLLPDGYQTVGTRIDARHFAATPVGMRVVARAEVTKVDGRSITFNLVVEDERERIGEGTHERIIINLARFDQRVEEKASGSAVNVSARKQNQAV